METPTDNQDAPTPESENSSETAVETAAVPSPAESNAAGEGTMTEEGAADAAPVIEPNPDADPKLTPEQREARYRQALEGLLFITDRALSLEQLTKLLGLRDKNRVARMIEAIRSELDSRDSAIQLLEVADGFQMATRSSQAHYVRKLYTDRMTMRLSTAAHETLAIIAYKQPLTRAEIEQIRGVEVIAALETLLEKRLIRVVGRKETVGRPLMYGTTPDFLRHFGLRSLDDLPPIESFGEAAETPKDQSASTNPPVDQAVVVQPEDHASPAPAEPDATVAVPEAPVIEPPQIKSGGLWPADDDGESNGETKDSNES